MTTSEGLSVVIHDFSENHYFDDCPWEARIVDSETWAMPTKGDRALVATGDELRAWVVLWWPYD